MEVVSGKVEGMSCNNCALNISHYLEREGMNDILVSFATGDIRFQAPDNFPVGRVLKGIGQLGYRVLLPSSVPAPQKFWNSLEFELILSLVLTLLLMGQMVLSWSLLHIPWFQLSLAAPVYLLGMRHFGGSAWRSVRNGMANMDVLISVGASAAFWYSLLEMALEPRSPELYFDTSSAILSLVLLGNWLEQKSVRQTTSAIRDLARLQVTLARVFRLREGKEELVMTDNRLLQAGDLVLVNTGDQVPSDGKIEWGNAGVRESMITGESLPAYKQTGDSLTGGTILESGSVRMRVTATGPDTVLSQIIELVKQAQANKPPIQLLADRISAVFVPAVLGISLLTLTLGMVLAGLPFTQALMRGIAVLVVACPCAMGLATPAAVMVGLGRAARKGILIKGSHTLEAFRGIRTVVFDKTGTLTSGELRIQEFRSLAMSPEKFRSVVLSLERYTSHPVGLAICRQWDSAASFALDSVAELKGLGMEGRDALGNHYLLGSYQLATGLTSDDSHQLYLIENGVLAGWIDLQDDIRPEAASVIAVLESQGISPVLLSGDSPGKCIQVARILGISRVYGGQSPSQKLRTLESLLKEGPVAMVGDGINDAPSLARATIGISLSDASQVAKQSAQVLLLNGNLSALPLALGLGRETYRTIRQNLFWAFFYNILAIPLAATGFLSPIVSAGAMGLSDIVLVLNSLWLRFRRVA